MVTETITIPQEIELRIEEASSLFHIQKQEIVKRALLSYLDSLKEFLALKKEFGVWDKLSDEALLNFEHSL